jgi:hypothetical protein
VRQQLYDLRRSTLDAGRAVEGIGELRLLYEAATSDERRELIRLPIKRINYSGPKEPVEFESFDGGAVNLPDPYEAQADSPRPAPCAEVIASSRAPIAVSIPCAPLRPLPAR